MKKYGNIIDTMLSEGWSVDKFIELRDFYANMKEDHSVFISQLDYEIEILLRPYKIQRMFTGETIDFEEIIKDRKKKQEEEYDKEWEEGMKEFEKLDQSKKVRKRKKK